VKALAQRVRPHAVAACAVAAAILGSGGRSLASEAASVTLPAGPEHQPGFLRGLLYGGGYGSMWATPVQAPVLTVGPRDGLTQEPSPSDSGDIVHLRASTGARYVFVPLDPGRRGARPWRSRLPVVRGLLPDRTAATHPTAALVADALLDSLGVLHRHARLAVLEADSGAADPSPSAARLGIIEESLAPGDMLPAGWGGAARIAGTEEVLRMRRRSPACRVDARAYLTARFADYVLGDFPHDPAAWSWVGFPEGADTVWRPVSPDLGRPLARGGGLLNLYASATSALPSRPGSDESATPSPPSEDQWHGEALDRELLVELDHSAWDSIADAVAERLAAGALDSIASDVPPEMRALGFRRLADALTLRRDALGAFESAYYRQLNEDVDFYAADFPESIRVVRADDCRTQVEIFPREAPRTPGRARGSSGSCGTTRPARPASTLPAAGSWQW